MGGQIELTERKVARGEFVHAITTWVSVPPEVAFDYVADIRRHGEWAENPMTVEMLDPPPVHMGTRYRAAGHQGGRDWPSDLVVTDFDRPTQFAFTATGGPISATKDHLHRHEFQFSAERGGTRLMVRRANPISNRAVRLFAPMITRWALLLRLRTIENLRQRLEGLGPRGLYEALPTFVDGRGISQAAAPCGGVAANARRSPAHRQYGRSCPSR